MKTPNTLLPHLIQHNAQSNPSGTFAIVPVGGKYSDGFKNVTHLQFLNAIDYTARLIEKNLGKGQNNETVAYIGPGDIRYSITLVAAIKAGYKAYLPSPRNSNDAHLALLGTLRCAKLIQTDPQAPCIPMILREMQLETMTLPSLQRLLDLEKVERYPYGKTYAEAKTEPIFVLHTSGSTGIPKLLNFTNDFVARICRSSMISAPEGHVDITRYHAKGRFLMTLPSFHIAGLGWSLLISTFCGCTPVYCLPGPPPTVEGLISAINNTDIDWAFVPPVVIDAMGKDPCLLEKFATRLKYLFFTGGSVPKASGDIVARRLPIWQVLGSSECGVFPLIHAESGYSNSQDWQYVSIDPQFNTEMRSRIDDLYELVVVRSSEEIQPVFTHFPELSEYETRDLFRAHPTKQGLWTHEGRIDDVIVFLNGEKTNPISFEQEVMRHPEVKAALVCGAQRFEAALLIELVTDASLSGEDKIKVIDRIWPNVEKANHSTPAHARIAKSKIQLVDPQTPMLRAGKGTVQRKATLELYGRELDNLYKQDEVPTLPYSVLSDKDEIRSLIRNTVADMINLDDLDLFQLGLDSLGVLRLQRALKSRVQEVRITTNTIYSNPSVKGLTDVLTKLITNAGELPSAARIPSEEISNTLAIYCKQIDSIEQIGRKQIEVTSTEGLTFLLTGSTGALGSYLLHRLLSIPNTSHVYCLNRTSDAQDRQIKTCKTRGLTTNFPSDRVTFLTGDLTKRCFGLQEVEYRQLLSEVTNIVHNAWPVNFNLPLSAFKPSLCGVVALVRFSANTKLKSSIQFLSSISSVTSYPNPTVPEAIISQLPATASMGYGQSKYIAERILDHACKTINVRASIFRIGQVSGAAGTMSGWNRQEWLPSLVVSSAFIGEIPETLGAKSDADETVDWVPIDQLADVLVELCQYTGTADSGGSLVATATVFHITHPQPATWSDLLVPIKASLEASSPFSTAIKIVPYTNWLSTLKKKSAEAEKALRSIDTETLAQMNPAMKLIDFYESLLAGEGLRVRLAMDKTLQASSVLRCLEPIKGQWMSGWVREWMSAR